MLMLVEVVWYCVRYVHVHVQEDATRMQFLYLSFTGLCIHWSAHSASHSYQTYIQRCFPVLPPSFHWPTHAPHHGLPLRLHILTPQCGVECPCHSLPPPACTACLHILPTIFSPVRLYSSQHWFSTSAKLANSIH